MGSIESVKLAAEIQGVPLPEGMDADDGDASDATGGSSAGKEMYESAAEEDEDEDVMI